jgi:DNA-binding transcriptional ArsR family regulator
MDRTPADSDDNEGDGDRPSLSTDELLALLGHPLRREILRYCVEKTDPKTDLDGLTDHLLTEWEGEGYDRDRVALQLHHLHLPKLADMGLVAFDPDSGGVRYRPNHELERLIGRIHDEI